MVVALLLLPLRWYQRWISPALAPHCRFSPSCSSYAMEALRIHGALRGSWLAVRRLLRCHPWHDGGHDPVPSLSLARSLARSLSATHPGLVRPLDRRSRAGAHS